MINDKLLTASKTINESDLPCPEELLMQATYTRTLVGERDESSAIWETGLFCIGLQYRHASGRIVSMNGKVSLLEEWNIYDTNVELTYSVITIDLDSLREPGSTYYNTYIKITNNKTGISLAHYKERSSGFYHYRADEEDMISNPGVLDYNGGVVDFTVETIFD